MEKSNKQLFGYEQVAKRIGNIRLNDRASHSRYFSSDELEAQFFC